MLARCLLAATVAAKRLVHERRAYLEYVLSTITIPIVIREEFFNERRDGRVTRRQGYRDHLARTARSVITIGAGDLDIARVDGDSSRFLDENGSDGIRAALPRHVLASHGVTAGFPDRILQRFQPEEHETEISDSKHEQEEQWRHHRKFHHRLSAAPAECLA